MNGISSIALEIFNALYYIFPAYCANGAPVLFGGGRPIDGGKKLGDGKPIFGSHKTIRNSIHLPFYYQGVFLSRSRYAATLISR